jgi:hypothetical protein
VSKAEAEIRLCSWGCIITNPSSPGLHRLPPAACRVGGDAHSRAGHLDLIAGIHQDAVADRRAKSDVARLQLKVAEI